MTRKTRHALLAAAILTGLASCGEKAPPPPDQGPPKPSSGLTAFQEKNGIGPMTSEVELEEEIDQAMAAKGQAQFDAKCSACHKFEEKYVGPALGDVTVRRTPTYVLNMILNPDGMTAGHPAARQLLGEYMTQMPNLGLTQDEARELLEYLRTKRPTPADN